MPYTDPDKKKAYAKQHYEKNKAEYKARAREFTNKNREVLRDWLWDYWKKNPCVDCGETDPIVLEFDHQRDKEFNIATMTSKSVSLTRLKKEVAKCDVRCANCHLRKTADQFGWWTKQRA